MVQCDCVGGGGWHSLTFTLHSISSAALKMVFCIFPPNGYFSMRSPQVLHYIHSLSPCCSETIFHFHAWFL